MVKGTDVTEHLVIVRLIFAYLALSCTMSNLTVDRILIEDIPITVLKVKLTRFIKGLHKVFYTKNGLGADNNKYGYSVDLFLNIPVSTHLF